MTDSLPIVLLTRPLAQSKSFSDALNAAENDLRVLISPLIEIQSIAPPIDMDSVKGVIFTSQNAVSAVPSMKMPAWCVGDQTAAFAQKMGWQAKSAGGDAEALFQTVQAERPAGPLLHLRGEFSRGKLAQRLTAAGIPTSDLVVYRQPLMPFSQEAKSALVGEIPVILPLFSPRTARHFAQSAVLKAPVYVVAMSDAVAKEVEDLPIKECLIVSRPTAQAMLDGVHKLKDAA